jgi:hypothetical protein
MKGERLLLCHIGRVSRVKQPFSCHFGRFLRLRADFLGEKEGLKKARVLSKKTTRAFWKNHTWFLEKPHVLFWKTTRGFSAVMHFHPIRCPSGEVQLWRCFNLGCEDILISEGEGG